MDNENFIICSFCASLQDFDEYKKQLLYSQFSHPIKQNNESYTGTFLRVSNEHYRSGLQKENGFFEGLKTVF